MIVEKTFYGYACDKCGTLFTDGEHSYYKEKEWLMEWINEDRGAWEKIDSKLYCPCCYKLDDETDEYIVKTDN